MLYSFMYVFVFSIAAILIQHLYFSVPPTFSLLVSSTIATAFFTIINYSKLKEVYKKIWSQKLACFLIMLNIFVMWNCSMIAPGLIGASLTYFLYFAWLGMLGLLASGNDDRNKFYSGIFVLTLIGFVLTTKIEGSFSNSILWGMVLAIVGGTMSYIYFKQSQSLVKKIQLSPTQILAFRFLLTILILLAMFPKISTNLFITWKITLELILLAILSLIIPMYFQQKALDKISSEESAIILSLTPVVISFLQELVFKDVDFRYLVIYFFYTLAIAYPYLVKRLNRGFSISCQK